MVQLFEICEACHENPIQVVEDSEEPSQPYRLCKDCHSRLLTRSLRPKEWYNLAVIHSPNKFYLHDDFYDDNGEATQPEDDVVSLKHHKAPSLEEVRNNLESLLDYSMTRWFLEESVINAIKEHNTKLVFQSVRERFSNTVNFEIKARLFEIVAKVLGPIAEEWIREQWSQYDEEFLIPLSVATASCLPLEEGLSLITERLTYISEKQLPTYAFSCLYRFRSPLVLDWIERNVTVFHDSWGRLAAISQPTWKRMKIWLNKGRPLSLIALGTMTNCVVSGGDPFIHAMNPQIFQTSKEEVESVLREYEQKDNVHRVRRDVGRILDNRDQIFI